MSTRIWCNEQTLLQGDVTDISDIFCTPLWLHESITKPGRTRVIPIDASWHMPNANRNALEEYKSKHIPNSRYFDLDRVASEHPLQLPHMFPTQALFSSVMKSFGIQKDDHIVVYDSVGIFSAPRVYWTFKLCGHQRVSILDGGLPGWLNAGYETNSGITLVTPTDYVPSGPYRHELVAGLDSVQSHVKSPTENVRLLDARPQARFNGEQAEPRAGLRSGHMPHSYCIPFQQLLRPDQSGYLKEEELKSIFEKVGKPVADLQWMTTCGSGVTACILAVGLRACSAKSVRVYDGSWCEWGREEGADVQQRPVQQTKSNKTN